MKQLIIPAKPASLKYEMTENWKAMTTACCLRQIPTEQTMYQTTEMKGLFSYLNCNLFKFYIQHTIPMHHLK